MKRNYGTFTFRHPAEAKNAKTDLVIKAGDRTIEAVFQSKAFSKVLREHSRWQDETLTEREQEILDHAHRCIETVLQVVQEREFKDSHTKSIAGKSGRGKAKLPERKEQDLKMVETFWNDNFLTKKMLRSDAISALADHIHKGKKTAERRLAVLVAAGRIPPYK
jgi:hypothetical protein